MTLVYCDLDALHDAHTRLGTLRDRLDQQASRHSSLYGEADSLLGAMAAKLLGALDPARWPDPFSLWEEWGLGRLVSACRDTHQAGDDVRGQARWVLENLAAAHGILVGTKIATRSENVVPSISRTLDALGELKSYFNPGNLFRLLQDRGSLLNRFITVHDLFQSAASTMEEARHYLESLSRGEQALLDEIMRYAPAAAPLLLGWGPLGAIAAAAVASTTPQGQQVEEQMLAFLRGHYGADVNRNSLIELAENLYEDTDLVTIHGQALGDQYTSEYGSGPLAIHNLGGYSVANLSGGISAGLGGPDGPSLEAQAHFDAAKVYAHQTVGNKMLGFTTGEEVDVGSLDASAGLKNGELGADLGASAVTEQLSVGANVAGVNVGVNGAVGLKWELGFEIGKKTEVKLPFLSFGFSVGSAS